MLTVGVLTALPATGLAGEVVRDGLRVRHARATGLASFVTSADGGVIPVTPAIASAEATPNDFLDQHGHLFGLTNRATQLNLKDVSVDALGHRHTSYSQVHRGVPVFGGTLRVHQEANGAFRASNGAFFPIRADLDVAPTIGTQEAVNRAADLLGLAAPDVEVADLVIVDPGWYGDPSVGAHLAYYLILSNGSYTVREGFFLDAHTGKTLDRWNLVHTAKVRSIFDDVLNSTVRNEDDPPTGDFESDAAYDYAGDTYDYLFRAFGRNGLNGSGGTLFATVHLQDPACPNAFGGTGGTFYCDGTVTDDIVAHEFGHGLTGFTANLISQNQSGQLNESYSDILGEIVDLLNGDASFAGTPGGTPWPGHDTGPGTDTPNALRTGCATGTVMTVNAPPSIAGDFSVQAASFGTPLTTIGTTGDLIVADPVRGCDDDVPFNNAGALSGKIVLIDRGDCNFTEKVLNAQDAGAIAVIVANNVEPGPSPMGGGDPSVTIPSVGSTLALGDLLKDEIALGTVNVTLRDISTDDVRWLVGEDASGFGGAIRDMWQPSCAGDPDRANDPLQVCDPGDSGGVHSGAGIPNHAFAMLTDGKDFNGQTVNAIGLFKSGAVWHRALTTFLTSTSDFQDAYAALNQAASDLIGTMIKDPRDGSDFGTFTASDAAEVDKALLAVEMNTRGRCGTSDILDLTPIAPPSGLGCSVVYSDDFESGTNGWTVSNTGPPTPYDWEQTTFLLPFGRSGVAWLGEDRNVGNCSTQDESAVHSLFSPTISVNTAAKGEPDVTFLARFAHFIATEAFFDGGNVSVRVDGGAWQLIPFEAFTFNGYNATLAASDNTNPLAGQRAFTGTSLAGAGWGISHIDLTAFLTTPGPHDYQFRFDLGKDGCSGVDGWFIDDFSLHYCANLGTIPDPPVGTGEITKTNRYLRFSVPESGVSNSVVRVRIDSLNGFVIPSPNVLFVGAPIDAPEEDSSDTMQTFRAAPLQCTPHVHTWSAEGIVSVYGAEIIPGSVYDVQVASASCPDLETTEDCWSSALTITTAKFADVVSPFSPAPAQPDFQDIKGSVDKFLGNPTAPIKAVVQLQPNVVSPDRTVNFKDINLSVQAFLGSSFASIPAITGPCACPSVITCGTTPCMVDFDCDDGLCVDNSCTDACGRCAP